MWHGSAARIASPTAHRRASAAAPRAAGRTARTTRCLRKGGQQSRAAVDRAATSKKATSAERAPVLTIGQTAAQDVICNLLSVRGYVRRAVELTSQIANLPLEPRDRRREGLRLRDRL